MKVIEVNLKAIANDTDTWVDVILSKGYLQKVTYEYSAHLNTDAEIFRYGLANKDGEVQRSGRPSPIDGGLIFYRFKVFEVVTSGAVEANNFAEVDLLDHPIPETEKYEVYIDQTSGSTLDIKIRFYITKNPQIEERE